MKRVGGYFIFLLATCSLAVAYTSDNRCLGEVCFERTSIVADNKLVLRGLSLFEWYSFDVYTAAIYAPENVTSREALLTNAPKELVLEYHTAIGKKDFAKSGLDILSKHPEFESANIKRELDKIHQLFEDVKSGDRYSLSYIPGRGTELSLNGESKGLIEGQEFARFYFGIWLSDYSVNEDFTDRLLSNIEADAAKSL